MFCCVAVLCSAPLLELTCACLFSVPMSAKPLHVDPMIQGSLRRTGNGILWPVWKSFQNLVSPVWLANWFWRFQTARTRLTTVGRTLLAVAWNAVLWCRCLFKAFPYWDKKAKQYQLAGLGRYKSDDRCQKALQLVDIGAPPPMMQPVKENKHFRWTS